MSDCKFCGIPRESPDHQTFAALDRCNRMQFDAVQQERDAARRELAIVDLKLEVAKRALLDIAEELDEMGDNHNARYLCNKATYALGQIEREGL